MSIEAKTTQLVTTLLRETLENNLNWNLRKPPNGLVQATDQVVPLFLQTVFKKKKIGIYEARRKHYIDDQDYTWTEKIGLCVVDDDDNVVWESPLEYSAILHNLYSVVREKVAGIDELFDSL
ncbi:hypothetical protein LG201_13075 [Methylobacillus gramineus]|uniref:hypothetical protein n=1 Tax=Methylobacillus gramineus TaxID=755169 RepID=UPI001CFFE3F2|nr:hypothetical protein [Methylobacillus gramineus]MCB5186140.1 hypothetical protein [Methylobacillus gramineus]